MKHNPLKYIALGDSFTRGFVDLFAAQVEVDFGVPVNLHDYSEDGQGSAGLLHMLRANNLLRTLLQGSDLVTFMIPMAHFKEPSTAFLNSGNIKNHGGMHSAYELYRRDADLIFEEILTIRKPSETILRVMDCYLPPYLFGEWQRLGCFQDLKAWWDMFNAYVAKLAHEHDIPLVCVRDAFNGTCGDINPLQFIGDDNWHTNGRGAALICELHHNLGYAPFVL